MNMKLPLLLNIKLKAAHGVLGFSTIAATGDNAVILHYPDLNTKLEAGELLLLI